MQPTVYTIGYGNLTWAQFVNRLPENATVVDVRRSPVAPGRPYFSRYALSAALPSYTWMRALGNASRRIEDGWQSPEPPAAVAQALTAVIALIHRGDTVVLMCCEQDAARCHRTLVADALCQRLPDLQVVHLPVTPSAVAPHRGHSARQGSFLDVE